MTESVSERPAGYFSRADPERLLREYPIGSEFEGTLDRLGREGLRRLQERRFLEVVARAWEVPFYRRRWGEAGLEPGDIRRLEDLGRIPPFSKSDLMESVERFPPYGDFHGAWPEGEEASGRSGHRPFVLHTTSGTTGRPQPLFFGPWDR